MSNLAGWLIISIIAVVLFQVIATDYRRKQSRTTKEYEEAVRSGSTKSSSLLRAGLLEVQKMFKPSLQAAINYVEDEMQGQTKSDEAGDSASNKNKSSIRTAGDQIWSDSRQPRPS